MKAIERANGNRREAEIGVGIKGGDTIVLLVANSLGYSEVVLDQKSVVDLCSALVSAVFIVSCKPNAPGEN